MYDTDFKVKYYDIQQELLDKLYNDPDPDYTQEDILDVCNKLYKDEITSVFYAEDILDDKIDQNMKQLLDKMNLNNSFQQIMNELKLHFINYMFNQFEMDDTNNIENIDFVIFLTLFSDKMFYITHKCICQQLISGLIDHELLVKIKEEALKILTK